MKISLLLLAISASFSATAAHATDTDIDHFKNWVGLGELSIRMTGIDPAAGHCEVMIGRDAINGLHVTMHPLNAKGNPDLLQSTFTYVYEEPKYEQEINTTSTEIRVRLRIPGGFDSDNLLDLPVPYEPKFSDIFVKKNDVGAITSVALSQDHQKHVCEKLVASR